MKRSKKIIVSVLVLICASFLNLASAQTFTAYASKNKVAVGEAFQIVFELQGDGSNFKAPSLKDFDVYSGPNQSNSMQIVNGNVSQSLSYAYVIAAKGEGKFTIAPASIYCNGATKQTNSMTIEVSKGTAGGSSAQGNQNNNSGTTITGDGNLFARSIASRTKAYVGEQITIVQKIYTRLNLVGFQDIKFPSYNGFWSQDLQQKGQISLNAETVDGTRYNVAEIKRTFLFAQRSGTLEIDPIEIACIIRQKAQARNSFDDFFGVGTYEDVVMKVKSRAVKIEVMPLPEENKPENFTGAVGNFTFKAEMNKNKVRSNEAINLNISISGRGNIKLIEPLKVNIPEDIEAYDPKVSDNTGVTANGVSGTKSFEYLLVPRHGGEYKVDKIDFSYFDPDKKTYITLPSPEFSINVEKGKDEDGSNPIISSVKKENVKMIGNDIRYIKTNVSLYEKSEPFFGSTGFYGGLLSPILLFASLLFVSRRINKNNSDLVGVKSRKANKVAKKRLVAASLHMKENKKELFYEEIFKALYGYISDKLNIPYSELNKEFIVSELKAKNINEAVCADLIDTLDKCEFARYAPSAVSSDLNEIYTKAESIITCIEEQI